MSSGYPSPSSVTSVLQTFSQRNTRWTSARFRAKQIPNPYPIHYRSAFASSSLLLLHSQKPSLRSACLIMLYESERSRALRFDRQGAGRIGLSQSQAGVQGLQVPLSESVALGISFRPGDRRPRATITRTWPLSPCRFGQAYQPLWPFILNDPCADSHVFAMATTRRYPGLGLPGASTPRGVETAPKCFTQCPARS